MKEYTDCEKLIVLAIKVLAIVIVLIPVFLFAEGVFYSDGNQFGKSQGKIPSREPYEVVDTIKMVAGTGSIVLHTHTTKEKHNLRPTSRNDMLVSLSQILEDTSGAVYYYGVYISDNLDTVILKSSNNADTSKVHIRILMK